MSSGALIAIGVAAVVVLAVIAFLTATRKADVRGAGALSRETRKRDTSASPVVPSVTSGREIEALAAEERSAGLAKPAGLPPVPWTPPDQEAVAVTRRQFFNRTAVTLMSVSLGTFGLAVIAFLYPKQGGGFGSKVNAGKLDDIIQGIRGNDGFFYLPEARTWITEYPADSLAKAAKVYPPSILSGMQAGINALYQKCPHLGCRVPECKSSQWFECPCHGSAYNRVGEKKAGPAPRGMDRFAVEISNGNVVVNTQNVIQGPPIGTNTTGQEAEGPHCISGGGEHK